MRSLAALFLLLLLAVPAGAVEPDEKLADPALEQRARDISQGIRCLVCQNQDIDSSNAELAKDLRVIIRERLVEGDSDAEVEAFLVDRYGDYVLLKPPFKPSTYLLWIGPFLLLLLGGVGVGFYLRREAAGSAKESGPAPLSESEREKLERILGGRDAG
ncbi:cytochrome c-type biogenesis protein [Limibacillus halophilus]|jgi:cytochrome c-type biogenesis protein CcmH